MFRGYRRSGRHESKIRQHIAFAPLPTTEIGFSQERSSWFEMYRGIFVLILVLCIVSGLAGFMIGIYSRDTSTLSDTCSLTYRVLTCLMLCSPYWILSYDISTQRLLLSSTVCRLR